MLSSDLKKLGSLYESVVIKESPDNITIGDQYYDYSQTELGNYTGIMNTSGKFVMSNSISGHYSLLSALRSDEVDIKNLITNFDSMDEIKASGITRSDDHVKFRIWPKFKVFSMWDAYIPEYKAAIDASIESIGSDPTEYNFDPPDTGGKSEYFKSYDDYVRDELTDQEREAKSEEDRRKQKDQLALGKYMAGLVDKKTDYLNDPSRSYYSRGGD